VTATNLAGFGYLALVNTALGYALWLRGIERLPATSVSFLALMSPVVATALGWAVLGETLTGLQLAGMALALVSLVAAQLPRRSAAPAAATGSPVTSPATPVITPNTDTHLKENDEPRLAPCPA
jgi:probable blue pigment (indigoidine) exporter